MYLPFAVYRGKLTISLTADLMIRKGGTKVAITAVNSKLPSAVGNPSPDVLANFRETRFSSVVGQFE